MNPPPHPSRQFLRTRNSTTTDRVIQPIARVPDQASSLEAAFTPPSDCPAWEREGGEAPATSQPGRGSASFDQGLRGSRRGQQCHHSIPFHTFTVGSSPTHALHYTWRGTGRGGGRQHHAAQHQQ